MLTQDDLQKIGSLMDKKLEKVSDNLKEVFDSSLEKTENRIVNRMIKSQNLIISHFDDNYMNLRERVERIEERLAIPHSLPN